MVGQPLSLVAALGAVHERPNRSRSCTPLGGSLETLADYHYGLDFEKRLERLAIEHREGESLLRRAASAAAATREAELAVVTGQARIGRALRSLPRRFAAVPPTAATGGYRTNSRNCFPAVPLPPARLLDQTLPIQHARRRPRTAVEAARPAARPPRDIVPIDRRCPRP